MVCEYFRLRAESSFHSIFAFLPSSTSPVADPGENLRGALHSNFGRDGCGGRG